MFGPKFLSRCLPLLLCAFVLAAPAPAQALTQGSPVRKAMCDAYAWAFFREDGTLSAGGKYTTVCLPDIPPQRKPMQELFIQTCMKNSESEMLTYTKQYAESKCK
jgi:hypothetical protein